MPQLRVARAEGLERRGRAIAILNIGGMDNQSGQVAERLSDESAVTAETAAPGLSRCEGREGKKPRFCNVVAWSYKIIVCFRS